VRVVLASGRRHDNMMPFHRALDLDDYVVSAQGALVKHAETGEVLYERLVPEVEARSLVEEGIARDLTVFCFGHQGVYVQRRDRWTYKYQQDSNGGGVEVVDLSAGLPEPSPLKIIWAADPRQIEALAAEAAATYAGRLGTCVTNPYYLEFSAPDANKGAGVAAVATRYGIMPEQVIAFGDGDNDVPMLSWAGLGIAMDAGRPAAKAAARRVAPPGDPETALARAIATIIGPADSEDAGGYGGAFEDYKGYTAEVA
jgi:Cof subfamily protein (haloacid dehalogenase superfamily)